MPEPATPATSGEQPRQALSLLDSTSIIVGIIIGSGIYQSSPEIAAGAARWAAGWGGSTDGVLSASQSFWAAVAIVGIWAVGGLVALVGALCYAELATAFPRSGGTYVFLSEGLGRGTGFAFAWAEFWIVRPGNVGAISFIAARYARQLIAPHSPHVAAIELVLAAGAIVAVSALNAVGLKAGKWTQNALTAGKLLGLAAIVVTAATLPGPAVSQPLPAEEWKTLPLALILVMFAYGGWADMSFVAAEVRDPARNISRALVLGTLAVAGVYIAVTLAFIHVLGVGGLAQSPAVAAAVMELRFGPFGSQLISLLVVVSCLGAINGMLFTGSRVYYALGNEHPTFRWLGSWHASRAVPLRSLAVQTLVTLGLVVGFGLGRDGFNRLVVFTGPFYWGFIGLVGVALIVLRIRGATGRGSYRVPLYPLTPLLFIGSSGAMVYAAAGHALRNQAAAAVGWASVVIVTGILVGFIDWRSWRGR
jgi:APA family basic amino acid/polyamine antiporter